VEYGELYFTFYTLDIYERIHRIYTNKQYTDNETITITDQI